ncbi:MAG: hypothetical protein CVV42_06785 [Candidatus Riflebacteria bacterium HGW-Riflebacteria-2]|jgi:rubrerythrin|nr:MAG: hypothetical protein CVV42_06785 [Candidatus Riflebacteria bacterium HGW-Riflebacteria-2]
MELANIAVVLKQNELLVAELYRECKKLFPDYSKDFESLALEEEGHAAIIDSIIEDIADKPEEWKPGKVSLQTLRVIQAQLKKTLSEVRSGEFAPHYALTALRSFEQSMCERSVERTLVTEVPEFQHLLGLFAEGFVTHNRFLQELEKKIFNSRDPFDSL